MTSREFAINSALSWQRHLLDAGLTSHGTNTTDSLIATAERIYAFLEGES